MPPREHVAALRPTTRLTKIRLQGSREGSEKGPGHCADIPCGLNPTSFERRTATLQRGKRRKEGGKGKTRACILRKGSSLRLSPLGYAHGARTVYPAPKEEDVKASKKTPTGEKGEERRRGRATKPTEDEGQRRRRTTTNRKEGVAGGGGGGGGGAGGGSGGGGGGGGGRREASRFEHQQEKFLH
eukprot:7017577-Pyramimonas_sp.AAC.1